MWSRKCELCLQRNSSLFAGISVLLNACLLQPVPLKSGISSNHRFVQWTLLFGLHPGAATLFFFYCSSLKSAGYLQKCSGWMAGSRDYPWRKLLTTSLTFFPLRNTPTFKGFAKCSVGNQLWLGLRAVVWRLGAWSFKRLLRPWMSGLEQTCPRGWPSQQSFTRTSYSPAFSISYIYIYVLYTLKVRVPQRRANKGMIWESSPQPQIAGGY